MALKFNVVTPSYNQGKFIERTIRSVLSQTGVTLDYVVCDGGSSDTTQAILSECQDRLRWVSEVDEGQADAVNKGIGMTAGDIIAWINSDDIYYPDTLLKVAAVFSAYPEVQVVYGDADWIDEYDNVLQAFPTEPWRYSRLKETCFLCQPAVFFKRSLVERHGGLDKSLQFCMDYDLWLRYGQHVDFYYLPEKLAGSRMYRSNKTMGQKIAVHREIIQMFQSKYGIVPANWPLGYALVKVEETQGISRFDRTRTYRFVSLLILFSCLELLKYNKLSLLKTAPKMLFWVLLPEQCWFRQEEILASV